VNTVHEIRQGAISAAAEQAACWFGRVRAGLTELDDTDLKVWLEASAANRVAYDEVARAWNFLGTLKSDPVIVSMRNEALSARPPRRFAVTTGKVAATLFLAFTLTASLYLLDRIHPFPVAGSASADATILQTAVGARSTYALEDGSDITLNTNSKVRISFGPGSRNVTLLSGQAFFEVAKDKSRPFIVTVGDREVIAVGTQFDVEMKREGVRVALLEGRVNVRPTRASSAGEKGGSHAVLNAGQILFAEKGSGRVTIKTSDIAGLLSWREGRVRFEETPLAEAVAEMNRYSTTPIRIADPRIAGLRISGAFRAGQSRSFVSSVTDLFPVKATSTPSDVELRSAD